MERIEHGSNSVNRVNLRDAAFVQRPGAFRRS